MCVCASGVNLQFVLWRALTAIFLSNQRSASHSRSLWKSSINYTAEKVTGPLQCEVHIMSHYQKLTAVVMGHLIADDGSGNGFPTSVHIVLTSFITRSVSWTSQPRNWSCAICATNATVLQFLAICSRWKSRFFIFHFNDASSFYLNIYERFSFQNVIHNSFINQYHFQEWKNVILTYWSISILPLFYFT